MEFIKPSEQFDLKGFYLEITSKLQILLERYAYSEIGGTFILI